MCVCRRVGVLCLLIERGREAGEGGRVRDELAALEDFEINAEGGSNSFSQLLDAQPRLCFYDASDGRLRVDCTSGFLSVNKSNPKTQDNK